MTWQDWLFAFFMVVTYTVGFLNGRAEERLRQQEREVKNHE